MWADWGGDVVTGAGLWFPSPAAVLFTTNCRGRGARRRRRRRRDAVFVGRVAPADFLPRRRRPIPTLTRPRRAADRQLGN